ncbi:MAG TPA: hypothetical protein VH062_13335 [Polyangiaceae bacterium]|jgi:hypothetical protein|nr:hypothetical protein [Polyangiaceae bacterium]
MFRIKAIAAMGLAGLGGATVGTDAYLTSRHDAPPRAEAVQPAPPAPLPAPMPVAPAPAPAENVIAFPPTVIYSRLPTHRVARAQAVTATPKATELVPCSDWHSLESGPAGRSVQMLCVRPVQ